MAILLVLLITCGVTIGYSIRIEFAIPISCCAIILVTYFLSLLGIMGEGLFSTMVVFALIFLLYEIHMKRTQVSKTSLSDIFSPGLALFCVLVIFMFWFTNSRELYQWDEFSHWGLTVKAMYYSDKLSVYPSSMVFFREYPPGIALWQYLFVRSLPVYRDDAVLFSYNVFMISMMMPVFTIVDKWSRNMIWRTIFQIILCTILVLGFPYLNYSPWEAASWRCIYAEQIIICTFFFGLCFINSDNTMIYNGGCNGIKDEHIRYAIELMIISVFPILKASGYIMLITLNVFLILKSYKRGLLYTSLSVLTIIPAVLWSRYIDYVGINRFVENRMSNGIKELLTSGPDASFYIIIRSMLKRMALPISYLHGIIPLSVFGHMLLWTLITLILSNVYRKNRKKWIVSLVVFLLVEVTYQTMLLLTYRYVLSEEEAASLAGWGRYNAVIINGITMYYITMLFVCITHVNHKKVVAYFVSMTAAIIFMLLIPLEQSFSDFVKKRESIEMGYLATGYIQYSGLEQKLAMDINESDRIYILSPDDLYGYYAMRKILLPASTNNNHVTDDWESVKENILQGGYNMVFVGKAGETWPTIKDDIVFSNGSYQEYSLYRVESLGDRMQLRRVQ